MNPKINTPSWLQWDEENIKKHDSYNKMHSYIYGVKDIQVINKEYVDRSIYVSTPIVIDGNVAEVSLETDDYNQVSSAINSSVNPFDTAIEYYISFKETPALDDWIPILPKNQSYVENELLLFNQSASARLRFKRDTSKEISVFKNGVKMEKSMWSFGNNSIHIDTNFDRHSKYTTTYFPDQNTQSPWDVELTESDREILSFINDDGSRGELFVEGTNRNGAITLSKYPYIDYQKINTDPSYRPLSVEIENASIAIPGNRVLSFVGNEGSATSVKTKNITDYRYLNQPLPKPYDMSIDFANDGNMTNPFLEYYQEGRKLYFTETFNNTHIYSNMETNHGEGNLRVNYNYLRTKIRIKIILRNTSNKGSFTTPRLNKYNLIFKVIR